MNDITSPTKDKKAVKIMKRQYKRTMAVKILFWLHPETIPPEGDKNPDAISGKF